MHEEILPDIWPTPRSSNKIYFELIGPDVLLHTILENVKKAEGSMPSRLCSTPRAYPPILIKTGQI